MPSRPNPQFQYQRFRDPNRRVRTNVAARMTGLSCRMIRHLAQCGILPAVRNGKRSWTYCVGDLEKLADTREHCLDFGLPVRYILLNFNTGLPLEPRFFWENKKGTLSVPGMA